MEAVSQLPEDDDFDDPDADTGNQLSLDAPRARKVVHPMVLFGDG
jgi:hypothetical protein